MPQDSATISVKRSFSRVSAPPQLTTSTARSQFPALRNAPGISHPGLLGRSESLPVSDQAKNHHKGGILLGAGKGTLCP